MRRDPTQFRERFKRWKLGIPAYKDGKSIKYDDEEDYQLFLQSLPDNLRKTDSSYRMRRGWELYGKPKDMYLAAMRGFISPEDDGWHSSSVGYDKATDSYELLKANNHPTRWMEDVYGYWKNPEFLKDYILEKSPFREYGYDRYVPRVRKLLPPRL